ncbi:MAG: DUF1003 domain-containing protein [Dehalococcoidia bacterium]
MVHFRFHEPHRRLAAPFGSDAFGRGAEWFARAFGTPYFLVVQTGLVIVWIAANAAALADFDPYPFILLNLAFSTQAAYAAPLILLAATRQADRDHAMSDADARHREELSRTTLELLSQNTVLTQQVADLSRRINDLTEQIHAYTVGRAR